MNHSLYVTAMLHNADDAAVLLVPICMLCFASHLAIQWVWEFVSF